MVTKKWTVEMKDIRDVLLLAVKGRYSAREIATSLGISHQSVTRYLAKIEAAGLAIESALEIDDETLEGICHPNRPGPKSGSKAQPDIAKILEELSVSHAPTRKVLYDEYRASNEGQNCYSYSQFTVMIKQDSKANNLTMHIEHIPGDKLFIDFAGDTVPIYLAPGAPTAEFEAQIFVATLAYSGETFCCATRHQDVASVIDALQQSLYAFGGVTARIVPDNMATAVIATKAKKGALKLNPSFLEFANHVGAIVSPTRVRRPKDYPEVLVIPKITA